MNESDPLNTPIDEQAYDDTDLLSFGRYKNERLMDVPALLNLYWNTPTSPFDYLVRGRNYLLTYATQH